MRLSEADRERFEKYVDRSGGPDACHPWTGYCLSNGGHGRFQVNGRMEYAHRVAWCLAGNEITEEKPCILHDCPGGDLPSCCNERHLWDGTVADNNRDMARKGRGQKSKRGLPFGAKPNSQGFTAQLNIHGKKLYFGTFSTANEASRIATEEKRKRLARAEP